MAEMCEIASGRREEGTAAIAVFEPAEDRGVFQGFTNQGGRD